MSCCCVSCFFCCCCVSCFFCCCCVIFLQGTNIELKNGKQKKPKKQVKLDHPGYAGCFHLDYDPNDPNTYGVVLERIRGKNYHRDGQYIFGKLNIASATPQRFAPHQMEKLLRSRGTACFVGYPEGGKFRSRWNKEYKACVTGGTDVNGFGIIHLLSKVANVSGPASNSYFTLTAEQAQQFRFVVFYFLTVCCVFCFFSHCLLCFFFHFDIIEVQNWAILLKFHLYRK